VSFPLSCASLSAGIAFTLAVNQDAGEIWFSSHFPAAASGFQALPANSTRSSIAGLTFLSGFQCVCVSTLRML
jgi:hypothetical protein